MMQHAKMLIELIKNTVEPDHWQPKGSGAITYYQPADALVIRASAEIHFQLAAPHLFGR